eukprot:CAMPEP_0115562606 /NCGR_PEP_ID=MMETSP0271-20121206/101605_1 /TAXON_ID=71861 /ORGANISM="Scrippsiella trochoidea, Strain CCMP3099" /LENGTH=411 /DNA_ID=CAMNT_0002996787 /DNA_START=72 /DNA_END=1303 /DNA_ORIENTATION=+
MATAEQSETDTGIVCRLAHDHLGERLGTRNEVLNRLPRNFRGTAEELGRGIHTNLEAVPNFKSASSAHAIIFQKLVAYQWEKEHHKPPSRIERLQGCESFTAKRVVCELLKAWAVCNKDVEEHEIDDEEVKCHQEFVIHLLHYYDRWSSKYISLDGFCKTLVAVHHKLQDLKCSTMSSERQYAKVLERLYEKSSEMCDHAFRIALLSVTDNHSEFETFCQRHGPISLTRFPPAGCCAACAEANVVGGGGSFWSLWTHEHGAFKSYHYSSAMEAERQFDLSNCCAILVGPMGKLRSKTWTGSSMFAKVLNEDRIIRDLHFRVDRHLALQMAAAGFRPPPVVPPQDAPPQAPPPDSLGLPTAVATTVLPDPGDDNSAAAVAAAETASEGSTTAASSTGPPSAASAVERGLSNL